MTVQTKRTTIYLDRSLHEALRLKATALSCSMSDLVNIAVREALADDAEDNTAFEERATEPVITYDEMVKGLKQARRI